MGAMRIVSRFPGTVIGTLLNDPAALAALGSAVDLPPYKAPPRAPVLYVKPRNTYAGPGARVAVPMPGGQFEIGASLGLVIGRTACRVSEAQALGHLAGYVIVIDLAVPHEDFYRPSVRFRARDSSCLIGSRIVPCDEVADADALAWQVSVDGLTLQRATTRGRVRGVARLLADVTEFMTLRPGDILMLGVSHGAPKAGAGQRFEVEFAGLGQLGGSLIDEATMPGVQEAAVGA